MHLEPLDVHAYIKRLRASPFASKVIAEILYKDQKYPVLQLDITGQQAEKKLLLFAGVHGNEFAATLAVEDIVDILKKDAKLYSKWSMRILAPLNPVGLAYQSRYNEEGYDINRDFRDFVTTGARLQRDAISGFSPDALVTLHESPEPGFFMFAEGKLPPGLKSAIAGKLAKAGIVSTKKMYLGVTMHEGIWEKSPLAFLLQRLLNMHTLGSYVHASKIPTITTESTWSEKDIEARKTPHVLVVRAVLEHPELF